ncbi:hypothetical protein [Kordia zhangzhouensis]|uniref:hypothetical protein n=1 Tax=Kordia zhangzhouensis TaxID=1620405 RepID=UPI000629792E|nr:hypothetical protein [Kordia zhangzhouensis]
MKPTKTYLKGRSVFIVSLMVIGVTAITVYLTGSEYNRSITGNFFISLGIISVILFSFLTYGLYKGIEIEDNFPKLKGFSFKSRISSHLSLNDLPEVQIGDGIGGLIVSVVLWILISIAFIILLLVLETILWFSLAIILAMLYWVFFRAMRLVFSKAYVTENDLGMAAIYAFSYTFMYIAWIFGVVYITTLVK